MATLRNVRWCADFSLDVSYLTSKIDNDVAGISFSLMPPNKDYKINVGDDVEEEEDEESDENSEDDEEEEDENDDEDSENDDDEAGADEVDDVEEDEDEGSNIEDINPEGR